MRRFGVLLLLVTLCAVPARGQRLSIDVITRDRSYLPNETLMVGVRIKNQSGQAVILAQDNQWVDFLVADSDKQPVPRVGHPAGGEVFVLVTGKVAVKWFNLAPHFDLSHPGPYVIHAQVKVPQWKESIPALPARVNVVRGIELARLKNGVPAKNTDPPEVRVYSLQKVRHVRYVLLYLRVEDEESGRVYRVEPLGRLVAVSRPEYQMDRHGRLHVLFQNGAKTFSHCLSDADGRLRIAHTYYYGTRRPVLSVDSEGETGVLGGRRIVTKEDWPPPVNLPKRRPLPSDKMPQTLRDRLRLR